MAIPSHTARSLKWFGLSAIAAPVCWGVAGAFLGLLDAQSLSGAAAGFALSLVYLPLYALVVVVAFAPIYAGILLSWPYLAAKLPALERSHRAIALSCALLAVPAALVVSNSRASGPGGFDYAEFARWFFAAGAAGWLALSMPRLWLQDLGPGQLARRAAQQGVEPDVE